MPRCTGHKGPMKRSVSICETSDPPGGQCSPPAWSKHNKGISLGRFVFHPSSRRPETSAINANCIKAVMAAYGHKIWKQLTKTISFSSSVFKKIFYLNWLYLVELEYEQLCFHFQREPKQSVSRLCSCASQGICWTFLDFSRSSLWVSVEPWIVECTARSLSLSLNSQWIEALLDLQQCLRS